MITKVQNQIMAQECLIEAIDWKDGKVPEIRFF